MTAMSDPAKATTESSMSYLADLLNSTRDELNRADSKASLLLAAVGVTIGALISGITGSKWTPTAMNVGEQVLWWTGIAAASVGVLLIAACVFPRIQQRDTPHPGLPAYYGDVAAYPDIESFREAVMNEPDPRERLMNQAYVVSRIVQHKYVLLRRGLLCLLVAVVACALAVGFNVLLQ